ncbi:MAG: DUF1501 domain-containing protein [Nitrospinae bacterium]|nr:DUF1501 domain-containing protein [Nitrospinota bacterium]
MAGRTTNGKEPTLVVLQLVGANDYLNTVIPYSNPLYYDNRPTVHIPEDRVLHVDDKVGFNPNMRTVKRLYDEGKVAVINGIGYPNPNYSHFRSMDIWYTCEPEKVSSQGWLGKAVHDLDPKADNVLTAVNFGRGMPRALSLSGVPVASVAQLDTYGVLSTLSGPTRPMAMETFTRMYTGPNPGDEVMRYMGQTGLDAQKGADILRSAVSKYASTVKYPEGNSIAASLKAAAQVKFANLGTRLFYTAHGSFDTHASELPAHAKLWMEVDGAIDAFFQDLREHNATDDTIMLLWTEFGRRVRDNGSGTDHGAGGVAFVIGEGVKGGMYCEYPSLRADDLTQPSEGMFGNLRYNYDFRGLYSTILDRWLGLDAKAIVGGTFEQLAFI